VRVETVFVAASCTGGETQCVSFSRPEGRCSRLCRDARYLWQGPSPLPQRPADPWPAGGPKPPASARPALGGRFSPAGSGAGLCWYGWHGSWGQRTARAGKRSAFPVPARTEAEDQSPNHQPRCHGRGHRPCHSATLTSRPPGAQSPRPAPAPPPAGASRPPGRAIASAFPGPADLRGTVSHGRGKRGAFRGPAQRRNPFPRIGTSFPAGRRSDCSFGTLLKPSGNRTVKTPHRSVFSQSSGRAVSSLAARFPEGFSPIVFGLHRVAPTPARRKTAMRCFHQSSPCSRQQIGVELFHRTPAGATAAHDGGPAGSDRETGHWPAPKGA
jgi:hypothetical protein